MKSEVGQELRRNLNIFFIVVSYLILAIYAVYWLGVLKQEPFGNDFRIYFSAYEEVKLGNNPYSSYQIGGFISHPFVLSLVSIFSWDHNFDLARALWMIISAICWIVAIKLLLFDSTAPQNQGTKVIFSLLLLSFAPFFETIFIGQINIFVALAIIMSYRHFQKHHEILSGIYLSIAILLKLSPIILIVIFLINRSWKAIISTVGLSGLFSLIPMVQFYPKIIVHFLKTFFLLANEIYTSSYNQSFLNILCKFLNYLEGHEFSCISISILVKYILGAFIIILAAFSIYKTDKIITDLSFSLLLVMMVIFSPLMWYHHLVFLIIPVVLLLNNYENLNTIIFILLGLFQIDRLFESFIIFFPVPVFIGYLILFSLLVWKLIIIAKKTNIIVLKGTE